MNKTDAANPSTETQLETAIDDGAINDTLSAMSKSKQDLMRKILRKYDDVFKYLEDK